MKIFLSLICGLIIVTSTNAETSVTPNITDMSTTTFSGSNQTTTISNITNSSNISSTQMTSSTNKQTTTISNITNSSNISSTQMTSSTNKQTTAILNITNNSTISSTQLTSSTMSQTTLASTTLFTVNSITNVFWVQTVITIAFSESLTNVSVTADIESRLSNAYSVGYNRVMNSGRKKRAATNGVNTLYLVSATRPVSTQTTTNLVYYVQAPDFVPPSTVVSNMNQLTLQEMSIIMGRPVTVVAQLYNSAAQSLTTDNKLWIFGAVFGSLAGAAFLIWLVLFIHRRCLIPYDEPLLDKKSSIDLESQSDLQRRNNQEIETIMPELHKSQYAEIPNTFVGTENYEDGEGYNQTNTIERTIEQEIYRDRIPQEIIIKHIYENMENGNHSDYRSQKSMFYKSRYSGTLTSSGRIRHSGSKKRRRKRKVKIDENEVEIKSDIQSLQSSSLQANPRSGDNGLESLRHYLNSENESNLIVVKPIEDEDMPVEDDSLPKVNNSKLKQNDILSKEIDTKLNEDDNVLYPVEFVDNYSIKHIYPIYTDTVIIPDTSINLVHQRESPKIENNKTDIKNENSKKKNMRTLDTTLSSRSKEM